jgi:putative hydrolase of the HAD superfamily
VRDALDSLGFADPGLVKTIAETYRDLREAAIRPFPGAIETLDRLRSSGVRTGLITNGSGVAQRAKIERFDLVQRFDYILIEGEFGCGKPDERVYRAALDALCALPDSAWMVGDNLEWDIAAPQRLGLRTVWVDLVRSGLPAGSTVQPDRIIRSIEELLQPPPAELGGHLCSSQ